MSIISEVAPFIDVIVSLIKLIEAIDPNAAQNPVLVKLQSALDELKKIENEL